MGWNTGEKINEIYGNGNYVDLGERGADTRLGRLNWSVDPLTKKFPSQSSYVFAGNNPVFYIDEKGEKKTTYYVLITNQGATQIEVVDKGKFKDVRNGDGMRTWTSTHDIEQRITLDIRTGIPKRENTGEIPTEERGFFSRMGEKMESVGDAIRDAMPVQVMMFGSGNDYENWLDGNPKANPNKRTISMEMSQVSEMLDLILLGFDGLGKEAKLETNPDLIEKLMSVQEKVLEVAEYYSEESKKVECPACNQKEDSTHVDEINGKGTYKKIKSGKN